MRIGIDMLGAQSPFGHGRGIGRYTLSLVNTLVSRDMTNQYFLYFYDQLPRPDIEAGKNCRAQILNNLGSESSLFLVADKLARMNPDQLDLLLLTDPMDFWDGYNPPPRPLTGLRMGSLVYDLIPAVFNEQYLEGNPVAKGYYRAMETLRRYDVLLAISECTKRDCEQLMGLSGNRVVNIGAASDRNFFIPAASEQISSQELQELRSIGVTPPYLFNVGGGLDDRKNFEELLRAFRLLPLAIRQSHQLVVTCGVQDWIGKLMRDRAGKYGLAAQEGIPDRLVLTDKVPDTTLRLLYQRCAAFVFPSLYEGFGLPLLEAMLCGAPVVAGNNSSQPEVVGEAGILVEAHDAAAIAVKLTEVLGDREMSAELRSKALVQADRFSWEKTADLALQALNGTAVGPAPLRNGSSAACKPALALFSPFPPKRSGISDYAEQLMMQLSRSYTVDLYHDSDYVPHIGQRSSKFGCYDYRLFERNTSLKSYRQIIYQMGNSPYHKFIYEMLLRHPGIVTIHDFGLSEFHRWYAEQPGVAPDHLAREFGYTAPDQAGRLADILQNSNGDDLATEFALRKVYFNRRIFDCAVQVVLHDIWGWRKVRELFPEHLCRTAIIPLGVNCTQVTDSEKAVFRKELNLPHDALIVASFGILHPCKMNVEAIEAFVDLARTDPTAILLFAGRGLENGEAKVKVAELGLEHRVRFLGHQPMDTFIKLMAVTDIGINLRRPPTHGETSAALIQLLAAGVPSIVTDVDTFASFPDHVVSKVNWDVGGIDAIKNALQTLACNRNRREVQGQAAKQYVRKNHRWDKVGKLYAELIEQRFALATRPAVDTLAA